MLRELPKKAQQPGEPERRWFFSHEMDLIVWVGADGLPTSFQLAYDKYRGEHLVSWSPAKGLIHYAVDDGEHAWGMGKTPLLHANGAIEAGQLLASFRAEAIKVPAFLREFVEEKLLQIGADQH